MATLPKNQVDMLLRAEKLGIIKSRDAAALKEFRRRGMIEPDPFELADKTPLKFDEVAEKQNLTFKVGGAGDPPIVDVDELELRRARASTGIVRREMPSGMGFKLGLSAEPIKDMQRLLKQELGQDVPIRWDRNTQTFQYLDPKTRRITNAVFPELEKMAGETPVIAGDIAGTVTGGVVGSRVGQPILGEAAGSAGGVFLGEYIRLGTGKLMGMNQSMGWDDVAIAAGKKAGIAGGITGVFGKLSQFGHAVVNFRAGRTSVDEIADKFDMTAQDVNKAVAHVDEILQRKGPIRPTDRPILTTSKRSGDETLLSDEQKLRGEKDFGPAFFERDKQDLANLTQAFDEITPIGTTSKDPARFADKVRTGRTDRAQQAVSNARDTLNQKLARLGTHPEGSTADTVRRAIEDKRVLIHGDKGYLQNLHNQWRKLAGVNPSQTRSQIQIPMGSQTRKLLGIFREERKGALLKGTIAARRGIFTKKYLKSKNADLVDLQRSISDIRSILRAKEKGDSTISDAQAKQLKRLIGPLTKDRDAYLQAHGRDDLLNAIRFADDETKFAADLLDRSIVGDLMAKRNGRYSVRSADVFESGFIKRGGEESRQIYAVISNNPEALRSWRGEIVEKYKREVLEEKSLLDEGLVARSKKHKKFMENYRESMEPFFSKKEMAQMEGIGGAAKVLEQSEKLYQNKLRMLNTPTTATGKDLKRLSSMAPEEVAPWIMGGDRFGPSRARRFVKLFKNQTGIVESARNGVRQRFRNSVTAGTGPNARLDPTAFNRELQKNKSTFKELFGEQYVMDLAAINDVMQAWTRKGRRLAEPRMQEIVAQTGRVVGAAPLSKRGLAFTAALKFRTLKGREAIRNAMLNPDDLHELVQLAQASSFNRRAFELMGSLGYIGIEE